MQNDTSPKPPEMDLTRDQQLFFKKLNIGSKLVLNHLMANAPESREILVNKSRLSERLGLHVSPISNALSKLIALGGLTKIKRHKNEGVIYRVEDPFNWKLDN